MADKDVARDDGLGGVGEDTRLPMYSDTTYIYIYIKERNFETSCAISAEQRTDLKCTRASFWIQAVREIAKYTEFEN